MKKFKLTVAMSVCMACGVMMTSCDKDSKDPGNDSIVNVEGTRLSQVNNDYIYYDSKGRISAIELQYADEIKFDYSKGKLYMDNYDELEEMDMKFNGDGYISELSASWDEKDDYGKYSGHGKLRFSYNGSGNLTKVEEENDESYKDYESGESYKYTYKASRTLTWKNGNMISVVEKGTENEGGDVDKWEDEYSIDYSDYANEYYQNVAAVSCLVLESDLYIDMAMAGLFGKGPAMLPESCHAYWDYGGTSTYRFDYTINNLGAITREEAQWDDYVYRYENISNRRDAKSKDLKAKKTVRDLFKHNRKAKISK